MNNIDKKSMNDIESRQDIVRARKLLGKFLRLSSNCLIFSSHAMKQMQARNLTSVDIINVLRAGKIYNDPELVLGTYRYRVQTIKITIVFAFRSPDKIVIITAWRNS